MSGKSKAICLESGSREAFVNRAKTGKLTMRPVSRKELSVERTDTLAEGRL